MSGGLSAGEARPGASGRMTAVVVAAGRGERLGSSTPKQFLDLGGLPVLEWSIRRFHAHPSVDQVVVVVPTEAAERPPGWLAVAARERGVALVAGGRTRAESVVRGVARSPDAAVLLIHDGVRPFAGPELIDRVARQAFSTPVIPVLAVHDTIKRIDAHGRVVETLDRACLRRAQTPQGFPAGLLRELHAAREPAAGITDEALLCEREGSTVTTVEGDPLNLKLTGPDDLAYARWLVDSGVIRAPTWR